MLPVSGQFVISTVYLKVAYHIFTKYVFKIRNSTKIQQKLNTLPCICYQLEPPPPPEPPPENPPPILPPALPPLGAGLVLIE